MRHVFCALVFMFTICPQLSAQDRTKAAKECEFDGIGLDFTLQEFVKVHPHAINLATEKSQEMSISRMTVRGRDATAVVYSFLGQKMWSIGVLYDAETVRNLGGDKVVLKMLEEKLGKANNSKITDYPYRVNLKWSIKDASREINAESKREGVAVFFSDIKLKEQAKKLMDKIRKSSITFLGFLPPVF